MSAIERITITISSDMMALVKAAVTRGEYTSNSEVLHAALLCWMREQDSSYWELEKLRTAIQLRLKSGPGIPAEDVYGELHELIALRSEAVA